MEITSLKGEISSNKAKNLIKKKEPSIEIRNIQKIYYPYFRLSASIKTKVLSRNVDGAISCIVDMVNGSEAITQNTCEKERIVVEDYEVLNMVMNYDNAKNKALTYIRHIVIQKIKLLKIPKITPCIEEILYKPYWIIKCSNNDSIFHLLMDSISGQYHLLEA